MLYESMAWACLSSSLGIPVPLCRDSVSSTLFFLTGWRIVKTITVYTYNMGILKAQMAVSLDGFIASQDGEIDWITKDVKESISKSFSTAEILISGTNTYNYIFERWGCWPYKSKKTFVISHNHRNVIQDEYLSFITEQPFSIVQKLKEETKSDLVVIGGGKLITSLINTQLLDELTIYTIPVMLGEGIPFIGRTIGSEWELSDSAMIDDAICTSYQFAYTTR